MATSAATKPSTNNTNKAIEFADNSPAEAGPAALVLKGDKGVVRVSEEVVAKIAGLAVREVDGVHELVPFGAGQTLSHLARTVVGNDMRDLGVRVEVGKVEAAVDVRIITDYGRSIPKIGEAIRKNLTERIETMTGLKVKEVNIDVLDLFFGDDPKKVAPPAPPTTPRVR